MLCDLRVEAALARRLLRVVLVWLLPGLVWLLRLCAHMCMDTRVDIGMDMRIHMCTDVYMCMCIDTCIDVCIDVCIDRCIGMCIDRRRDMRVDMLV